MQAETRQAVYGIIINEQGVLLIKRRDIPVWILPGGGLDKNESEEQGAIREVEEETGFQVEIVRKVAEYLPVNKMTQLTHLFECRITGGKALTGAETKEVQFFPLDKLPKMPPPYAGWIADTVRREREVLRKKIEGVNYFVLIKLMLQHPILVGRYLLTKIGIHLNAG